VIPALAGTIESSAGRGGESGEAEFRCVPSFIIGTRPLLSSSALIANGGRGREEEFEDLSHILLVVVGVSVVE
jgi:hypothetical protein